MMREYAAKFVTPEQAAELWSGRTLAPRDRLSAALQPHDAAVFRLS